jgi:hypothetical protein
MLKTEFKFVGEEDSSMVTAVPESKRDLLDCFFDGEIQELKDITKYNKTIYINTIKNCGSFVFGVALTYILLITTCLLK